ncbi:hypothetical protein V5O48_017913 [Marasmius crinis-equi]|uniref:Uncharacterized protein n=1 Tax=Marasmius crinis-equi TaxID=585013 RepID=A0ABR3EMQ1_9AGAR
MAPKEPSVLRVSTPTCCSAPQAHSKSPPASVEEVENEDNLSRLPPIPTRQPTPAPATKSSSLRSKSLRAVSVKEVEDEDNVIQLPPLPKKPTTSSATKNATKKARKNKKKSTKEKATDVPPLDDIRDAEDDDMLHGRGMSGINEEERVDWPESLLPSYLELGKNSKEKTEFWEVFPSEYFPLFPVSKYAAPPSTLDPLPALTTQQYASLSGKEKSAHIKKEKHCSVSDEQCIVAEITEDFSPEDQAKCRENLPRVLQPLLNAVSRYTGMSLFLQGGLELDHPDQGMEYDTVSLCSVAEGCPRLDKFDIAKFGAFGTHFLSWLNTVEKIKLGLLPPSEGMLTSPVEPPDGLEGLMVMNDDNSNDEKTKGKGKAKENKQTCTNKRQQRKPIDEESGDNELNHEDERSEENGKKGGDDDEKGGDDDEKGGDDDKKGSDDNKKGSDDGEGDGEEEMEVDSEALVASKKKKWVYKPSAYELEREKNIARNKEILAQIGLCDAITALSQSVNATTPASTSASARPRPRPKPKANLTPVSTRVTRSRAAAASTLASSVRTPDLRRSPSLEVPEIAEGGGPHNAANEDIMDVVAPSQTPNISDSAVAPAHPASCTAEESNNVTVERTTPQSLAAHSRPPLSTDSHRKVFLNLFEDYVIDFNPAVDRVEPEAYGDQRGSVDKIGAFLLSVPDNAVSKS